MYSAGVTIGERIRRWRNSKDWTQDRLAAECGVGKWDISRWERGENSPSYEALEKVVAGLGIMFTEFYSLGEETPSFDRSTEGMTKEELDHWRGRFYGARGLLDDLSDEELARVVRIVRAVVEGERKRDEAD